MDYSHLPWWKVPQESKEEVMKAIEAGDVGYWLVQKYAEWEIELNVCNVCIAQFYEIQRRWKWWYGEEKRKSKAATQQGET